MQPRRQQLSVPGPPGPRPVAPLLALLLLLALQGTGAAPAGAREAQEPDDYSWLLSWEPLDGILHQAAAAAVHFLNFRVGSPSALQGLSLMYRGVTWETPREEYHFVLSFTTEHYNSEDRKEEPLGDCHAEVIFRKRKPKPTVNITCEGLPEKNRRQQEDYLLYKHLKQLKLPLGVVNIPDNQGHINTSLKPLWDLAALGSSYVMWEKTTRGSQYHLAQLTGVKQWKTDGEIDFDYTVLLHEFSTQEIIPCRIHLVWYPGKLLKVKYHCQGQETLDEASGTEEGSAVAPRELSNF